MVAGIQPEFVVAATQVLHQRLDVATTATSRVRELSRGGRRKNDVIDASAAASVAALQGDARAVTAEDDTTLFALLEERRANLAAQRVRVNQLHTLMRDLIPGGARNALTAKVAATALRRVRPTTPAERTRKDIAWDLVREIRALDERLAAAAERMTTALEEHGSSLGDVDGIGPVLGVRLIGRTGPAARFRSSDAFASYAGVAPIEVSSGERITHRLSRSGDRQLNSALHLVAVTQVRMRSSSGRQFFDRKLAEGKTRNEALRCLKRRIATHVWRRMLADQRRRQTHSEDPALAA